MMDIIQAGKYYESNGSNDSCDGSKNRQRLLKPGSIHCQGASVSQPSLGKEYKIEGDNGNCAHCDE